MRRRRHILLSPSLLLLSLTIASIAWARPEPRATATGDAIGTGAPVLHASLCLWYDRSRPEWPSDLVSIENPDPFAGVTRLRLLGSMPNPSRGRTTIRFAAPAAREPATVFLHDIQGRLLCVLTVPLSAAGTHDVVWDGRDAAGRPVASGICFYRVRAAGETATGRMLVMR